MLKDLLEKIFSLLSTKVYSASSLSEALSGAFTKERLEKVGDENSFVQWIIDVSIPLGVTCAFVLLVYAGFMMVTSQGNPDKLQESREVITNAIIGFVVILLSVTLLYLIKDSLGLNI